ncbi:putative RNA polymerase II subunit B1 CTD phosphatase RPAP2 homolog [Papaver somniferum]|uniref:putative RNA polymerase II subunit B1 CTD phosphatase RPAP2 homolog n=1 Tax=Papaver somniferum TaxID=3469 RepID=UPI000E7027F0|nr:putative RNA polymerase II subunit B1 CTD phosphatase RPAP2 homolog [Papaver somniferum]XP_026387829.1 putative RNA polymerase II subunit B1 CTD phosphatase RPAP2 homolog [Papaver somniferum]
MAKAELAFTNDAVHTLQLALLGGIQDDHKLFAAGSLISKRDYEDVVTERSISNLCGYPLCNNSLPLERPRKGRYRISLKDHKVYDLQETYMYCSSQCVVNSLAFGGSLQDDRCPVVNSSKVNEVLKLFEDLSLEEEDLGKKKGDLGLSELRILEKMDAKVGEGDWISGPSDAIEGYVPKSDSFAGKGKGLKAKIAAPEKVKGKAVNEMEFMSSVIMGGQFGIPQQSKRSSKTMSEEYNSIVKSQVEIPEASYSASKCGSDINVTDLEEELCAGIDALLQETTLKSSLKSSGSNKLTHSVRWADEKETDNGNESHGNLCHVQEMGDSQGSAESSGSQIGEDMDSSIRLASAEACANALKQAAEVVGCGESDASHAVSEAGIIILPQHMNGGGAEMVVNALEPESAPLKWPTKPGVFNFEVFDSENSWFEPPPEGFSLSLSPFATMYVAVFGWVTSSSLAYIYGREEDSQEEFLSVNGRSYPYKIVLSDGRSSEIKQTLSGCLARALPGLVMDLRVPTPVSFLEQGMSRLIETMSFIDALPSFRMKQWHVIVLLFMDALSVCQIPGLSAHMTGTRMLTHKVLDGAQISSEEYELLKDHIIPLGRLPQFSTQSGG